MCRTLRRCLKYYILSGPVTLKLTGSDRGKGQAEVGFTKTKFFRVSVLPPQLGTSLGGYVFYVMNDICPSVCQFLDYDQVHDQLERSGNRTGAREIITRYSRRITATLVTT